MAPPLFKKVKFLNYPLDFGKKWKNKPILGNHKTWRGIFFGVIVSIIIVALQKLMFIKFQFFQEASIIDYTQFNFVLLGFLLGFGALLGDSVESFFKRRQNIKSGKPWIPWDQLDFVIGSLLFLSIVYSPSWQVILALLITVPFLHIATNHIGYYVGINKSKW